MVNAEAGRTMRKRPASSISQSLTADASSSGGTPGALATRQAAEAVAGADTVDKNGDRRATKKKRIRKYRDRTAYQRAYRQTAEASATKKKPVNNDKDDDQPLTVI